jgi:hypothetical protein
MNERENPEVTSLKAENNFTSKKPNSTQKLTFEEMKAKLKRRFF